MNTVQRISTHANCQLKYKYFYVTVWFNLLLGISKYDRVMTGLSLNNFVDGNRFQIY